MIHNTHPPTVLSLQKVPYVCNMQYALDNMSKKIIDHIDICVFGCTVWHAPGKLPWAITFLNIYQ